MLTACLLKVELVLCRFQIILMYPMFPISQMWTQSWLCTLTARKAPLCSPTTFCGDALPSLHSCYDTFLSWQSHSTPAKYTWKLAGTSHHPSSENEAVRSSQQGTHVNPQLTGASCLNTTNIDTDTDRGILNISHRLANS